MVSLSTTAVVLVFNDAFCYFPIIINNYITKTIILQNMSNMYPNASRRGVIAGLAGVAFATAGCLGDSTEETAGTPTASATATPTQTTQTAEKTQATDESDSINPADEEEEGPAKFNVTAVHAPDQVQIDVEAEIEIKNVGGKTGTLTSGISYGRGRGSEPRQWTGTDERIDMDFEAGETKTYSMAVQWPFLGTLHFRFDELYTTLKIEFVERVLSRDEPYETPRGIKIQIDDMGSQSHFVYTDNDGTEHKKFPHGEDSKYLSVELTATNVGDKLVEAPDRRAFFVTNDLEDGQHYSPERIYRDVGDWKFPFEKRLNAGASVSGKLLFTADKDVAPEDIAVGVEDRLDEGEYEAYWTP